MTFVQENKEKKYQNWKNGNNGYFGSCQNVWSMCRRKTLFRSEIRDAAVNPDSFIFLLKNQENMLCGYVYFQKTSQNEMADFLKIDQAVLKKSDGLWKKYAC